jgi:pyrroline-5-carboxylate reductase
MVGMDPRFRGDDDRYSNQTGSSSMTDSKRPTILLVGCGKMGSALLSGWLAADLVAAVTVVEPGAANPDFAQEARVRWHNAAEAVPVDFQPDVVLLAVKPQMMAGAVPGYRRFAEAGALVLSIAAGTTIAWFEAAFGPVQIVRVMPNTPAAIGRGVSVAVANAHVAPARRQLVDSLMGAVGSVEWVEDEDLINAVTAVSGSGPAYVFLLVEALAEAGVAAGLEPDFAMRLARETVSGSGELVRLSHESAGQLRRNVTSPNGTTQAALEVLMAPDGLQPLMTAAVAAATGRSRELAG